MQSAGDREGMAKGARRRPWLGTVITVVLAVCCVWVGVGINLAREYRQTEEAALSDAGNLARALEENLLRGLEAIDQQLMFVRSLYLLSPDLLDLSSESRGAYLLRGLTFQLAITDRNGIMVRSNLAPVTTRVDLSDREHIRAQLDSHGDRMFISKPVVGRVSGKVSINITRRIEDENGAIVGVAVISLDPAYLVRFHASLELSNVDIHIVGTDGVVRAGAPDASAIGRNIGGSHLMERARASRMGGFRGDALGGAGDNYVGFRKLDGFPLVVAVSMDAYEATASFRRDIWLFSGAGASFSLLAIGLGRVNIRRRQEQLRASDATLDESEARFRRAFEAAGHGMFLSAPDGRFLRMNKAFRDILGYSEAAFENLTLDDVTHPDERGRRSAWERALAAGDTLDHEATTRYRRADGSTIWVRVNVGLVRNLDGHPLYFITHARDITEQRRTEEKLRQAQKMEAVGQLTAGIAHDFNNLLGAVIGNLDISREVAATDARLADHHAGEALNAALAGAELVKRLLAFGRRQSLLAIPIDARETLNRLLPLLRATVGERMTIRMEAANGLWRAKADPVQVEAALLNLALNARDATDDGGEVLVSAANATIDAETLPPVDDLAPGDYVVISITDHGCGMAPEVIARAFEPFFTTKGVGAGSGLGLSMVLGTMQQMGGTARIYSEPGRGTTVRLYLPRAEDEVAAAARPAAAAQPTGHEHILVVEDNERIRASVVVMVESLGYRVSVADNADAALARWDAGERFDLVFTDMVMPGKLGGIDLARELRARDPAVCILLTTGFANSATLREDVAAMRLDILAKPYRKSELAARLRNALDGALQEA